MPVPMPSLMLPRIASGPITNRSDDETKPSTNVPSCLAPNFFRRFSPKDSNRISSLRAEPMIPPISKDPRMLNKVQPLGRDCEYSVVNIGITAPAAARIVIKPRMSVINSRVLMLKREPANTPKADPAIIDRTLIKVPSPINTIKSSYVNCIP